MDNLSSILQSLGAEERHKALEYLRLLQNQSNTNITIESTPTSQPVLATAAPQSTDAPVQKANASNIGTVQVDANVAVSTNNDDDVPLSMLALPSASQQSEPPTSAGAASKAEREAQRLAREAEKERRQKEAELLKAAKEEEKERKQHETDMQKIIKEEEKERLRIDREEQKEIKELERDQQKECKDIERETAKAQKESERERQRLEKEAARLAAEAARVETEAAHKASLAFKGLASFGFSTNVVKNADDDKNKLFTAFVQDKRVVPAALRFWSKDESHDTANGTAVVLPWADRGDDDASVRILDAGSVHNTSARAAAAAPSGDEESSLLHPSLCRMDENSVVTAAGGLQHPQRFGSFAEMIEASNACVQSGSQKARTKVTDVTKQEEEEEQRLLVKPIEALHGTGGVCPAKEYRELLSECPCAFHTTVRPPSYISTLHFEDEVVFVGFFAIGYDPCQSRPPYFGTHNHLQEGYLNEAELMQMARFAPGKEMPRLSTIDYDYDSGDDWDVVEGDEDIAMSSSGDSEEDDDNGSLDSSERDFINDEDDGSDSDCELQRKIMESRQRRLNRLRGKDKLLPSFSGPFVGAIPTKDHPLRRYDRFDRVAALDGDYFASMLAAELDTMAGYASPAASGRRANHDPAHLAELQQQKMAAALKNRREMTEEEIDEMHKHVAENSRDSSKRIFDALRLRHLCTGVVKAELERTLRRFYERKHNVLVRRPEPWQPTDERLFARYTRRTAARAKAGGEGDPSTPDRAEGGDGDGDGDEGDHDDDEEEDDEKEEQSPSPNKQTQEAGNPVEGGSPCAVQSTENKVREEMCSLKRPREETGDEGMVSATSA